MKINSKEITFGVPFYGNADYLEKTLLSIQAQTVSDWAAIVCDNNSPGTSARDIVAKVGDARITYTRNPENIGAARNWMRCIELTTTALVCLVHSDDELMPNYAEIMIRAHRDLPDVHAIACNAEIIDSNGRRTSSFRDWLKKWLKPHRSDNFLLSGSDGLFSLLKGNFIICPTVCYKREVFENIRFKQERVMVVDLEFYFNMLITGKKIAGLPDLGYRYRRHSGQGTADGEKSLKLFHDEIALWRWLAREADELQWHNVSRRARAMLFIKMQLIFYIIKDIFSLHPILAAAKIKLLWNIRKTNQSPKEALQNPGDPE
jgi:glycosyltransferase involved in cell wall biosynthesis